ncbi:MAG: hypothetical protein GF308_15070 [Candidatus Heimdallarchaeota archaeon]|nr:hypothetical protein [Candidatus Heimdallarchaeota archaeon]
MTEESTLRKTNRESRLANLHRSLFRQIQDWWKEHNWATIGFDSAVIICLLAFGSLVRLLLAYYFRMNFFVEAFENPWNRHVYGNPNQVPFFGFSDFSHYYLSWVHAWFEEGWNPYRWPETFTDDPLNYYSYPPLFLYTLVALWRPGVSNLWVALPMVIADAACAGLVYLLLKELMKNNPSRGLAFFGALLMAIAPINLIYDGVYWLNPGPVTLFTLCSFYFAIKKQWWQTFFWLAIATMTKQNALFFSYPLFMFMLAQKTRERGVKQAVIESVVNAGLFVLTCVFISIPWLFLSPAHYGGHLLFPGKPLELTTTILEPPSNQCVTFSWSLLVLGLEGWLLGAIAFGINSLLLMVLVTTSIALLICWRVYENKLDSIEFFIWIALYTVLSHIFMPRGVYKFYTAYYVPIILVALLGSLYPLCRENKFLPFTLLFSMTLFLGFNIGLLVIHRWIVPVYLFLVCLVLAVIGSISGYLIKKQQNNSLSKTINSTF